MDQKILPVGQNEHKYVQNRRAIAYNIWSILNSFVGAIWIHFTKYTRESWSSNVYVIFSESPCMSCNWFDSVFPIRKPFELNKFIIAYNIMFIIINFLQTAQDYYAEYVKVSGSLYFSLHTLVYDAVVASALALNASLHHLEAGTYSISFTCHILPLV